MILQPEESQVVTGEDNYFMAVLPLEEAESIPESLDDDVDLSMTSTTSISVIESKTKPQVLPTALTGTHTKAKKKKVTQEVVLEMQLEVLQLQKEMILLKNEKLRLQVLQLKGQVNSTTLMSSVENF